MKTCRMFVFIRIKQQFYYIAKQGYLHRNSRIGYTRHFKLQDGCHFFKMAATIHFVKKVVPSNVIQYGVQDGPPSI